MTEKAFMSSIVDVCGIYGYHTYHTHDSRRSEPGFPDLVIAGHGRVFYRELKLDKGRTTPAQDAWLDLLARNGADVAVWRPAMWPDIVHDLGGRVAA